MTPGILNSQEVKIDFNSNMLNFNMVLQLLDKFRKFEKMTFRWIALCTFRTIDLCIAGMHVF